jgi:23S rRNA pseudouridine1911/1915/1917 synthase
MSNEQMSKELGERILYCDANCIVVNKIAGEAVEGAGKGMIDLPRELTSEQLTGSLFTEPNDEILALPVAVHRLDVPVSGCAVFARTQKALSQLNASFKSINEVEKNYWAIVEIPKNFTEYSEDFIELVHWIEFDKQKNKSIAHNEPGTGRKKAVMNYRIVGRGNNYLFLEIELITGRHHQIRAQLKKIGFCTKGDLKYGARRSEPASQGGGIRLHARSISFPDPADKNKRINIQANPPLRDNLWLAFEDSIG